MNTKHSTMTTRADCVSTPGDKLGRPLSVSQLRRLFKPGVLVAALVLALSGAAKTANAQCPGGWVASPMSQPGFDRRVTVLHWWDADGAGPLPGSVVAGGSVNLSGTTTLGFLARWNVDGWTNIGTGVDSSVNAFTTLPTGELVAGGFFSNAGGQPAARIAKWNGAAWTPFGSGMNSAVWSLATRATGELWAGGWFGIAGGAPSTRSLARWTGSAWASIGAGAPNDWVWSIVRMPNGDMIAAGAFSSINFVPRAKIARWNGTAWSDVGGGVTTGLEIYELFVMPNGDLIASGNFSVIGGVPARNIARWNGTTWSAMGAGFSAPARDFAILASGELVAADVRSEDFTTQTIAKWNGVSWETLGSANGTIFDLLAMPNGDLLVGGDFTSVDGLAVSNIAVWRPGAGTAPTITASPLGVSSCPTATAAFNVTAAGPGMLSYAWQVLNGAAGWVNLSDGPLSLGGVQTCAAVLGSQTRNLRLDLVACASGPNSLDGRSFRAVVTSGCGSVTSNPAALTVIFNAPTIPASGQPQAAALCPGQSTWFSVIATTSTPAGNTYRWQWQPSGEGTPFIDLPLGTIFNANGQPCFVTQGVDGPNLFITRTALDEQTIKGYGLRCRVTNACGNSVISNSALFTLDAAPAIATDGQPQGAQVCSTGTARFTVTTDNGAGGLGESTVNYQWQIDDAGEPFGWIDLTDGPLFEQGTFIAQAGGTSSRTATITFTQQPLVEFRRIRCIVSNACESFTSIDVPLTISGPCGPQACALADVASDSLDTTRNPNNAVGPEDLDAFIAGFIAENGAIADVASDSLDTVYNPNGAVGPEDLDAFIASFIAGC